MTLTLVMKGAPSFYNFGLQIPSYLQKSLENPEKITKIILPIFKAGSSLFFFTYGSKELCIDARRKTVNEDSETSRTHRCFCQAFTSRYNYPLFHGLLFLGAAALSAFEALHEFALLNLGTFADVISYSGAACFLFANLVALEQNIFLYRLAEKKCPHSMEIRASAVLGIMSNIGYITAAATALLGASTALIVAIGCLSACFGGVKILYDFYTIYLQKSPKVIDEANFRP